MEAYRGLAILATNMQSALDPAFLRRLRFVVDVSRSPTRPSAQAIWQRAFPAGDAGGRPRLRRVWRG